MSAAKPLVYLKFCYPIISIFEVCTNGDISLDKPFNAYTLETFPLTKARNKAALICPFWADVDLNNGGDLWSRETTDPVLLLRSSMEGLFSKCVGSFAECKLKVIQYNNIKSLIRTLETELIQNSSRRYVGKM